jgi:hypothetical protein
VKFLYVKYQGGVIMLEKVPGYEGISKLIGVITMEAWNELSEFVSSSYDFEPVWDNGGKYGVWEVKYRRSGRTLCAFYVKEGYFTVLVVLGKAERDKFELARENFCSDTIELYENTHQYHDGKWLWVNVKDMGLVEDVKRLIVIKKKPKKT